MEHITLAFFKAESSTATLKDRLIAWWTKGDYSHVEIIIDAGTCLMQYSASPKEGMVRKKPHIKDNEMWDYVVVPVNNLSNIVEFLESTLGKKYDNLGILGFVIPIKDRTSEWFCSELASNALKIDSFKPMWYIEPSSISPSSLYKMVSLCL